MKHILFLEDDLDTRGWFSELLRKSFGDVEIVEADSLQQAKTVITNHFFSLAIIDIYLSDGRGIDFIKNIKQVNPGIFCIVVTGFDDTANIFDALKAGADGYLLKSQDKERIIQSLKDIMDGAPPLSPSVARRIIKHFTPVEPKIDKSKKTTLTHREEEVLIHIAKGMTRNEIAKILKIRPGTVAGYVKRIYEKLNISSRAEAALKAHRMGLI